MVCDAMLLFFQGPPGKDGLPGHPGQRGEVVRIQYIIVHPPGFKFYWVCLRVIISTFKVYYVTLKCNINITYMSLSYVIYQFKVNAFKMFTYV